ncbi:MAG: MMPL family transporter [Elusimicrobiota bacterium]|nr:MMPL family transporter [Elusimicrobiota bacterium]
MRKLRDFSLVHFSVDHPRWVVAVTLLVTLLALSAFPKVRTDTNPKNMLPADSAVRVSNDAVEKTFGLYEDMIVVGIKNEAGVLNKTTLEKIKRINDGILKVPGVAARDVAGFSTIDNVTVDKGTLQVGPLMPEAPGDTRALEGLSKQLFENPMFVGRIISGDGKTAAIYVPLEKGANGKSIADKIREIVKTEGGPENYYVAGDPVARDTFGAEMFKLMAIFAPMAGLLMFAARYLMFGDLFLSAALMMDAMIATIWSMGLLIALGYPIHIMSSMAPVFLMAIATDSIHIFNEFYFRYREEKDKKTAIIKTMEAVGRPVRYTALATAAGFSVLLFMDIVPVKIFGGLVAFGTVLLRVLSFSFIPAMFTFVGEKSIEKASRGEDAQSSRISQFLAHLARLGAHKPQVVVLIGLALFVVAVYGTTRIKVNNNMVEWFTKSSEVRTADRVMNEALGGTSLGYLVVGSTGDEDEFIKSPQALRYIEGLQRSLEKLPTVGKTTSVVDYVKRIGRVLHKDDPAYDKVPESKELAGQYLFLFAMSAKPSDLDNVVDPYFKKANIWIQLKTWDAGAMHGVIEAAQNYQRDNPFPVEIKPAGIAYFNLVWNNAVLWDMIKGFLLALVVIFAILSVNFRSVKWAMVGYIPLLFTVILIYGAVGFAGKDFDMPISVLSCLSLGMAVDFAIHFINRFRLRLAEGRGAAAPESIEEALVWTAARPGKGVLRNAILFAAAFSVMLFAPLTPYITVGAFIVCMMLLSAVFCIIYIPALIVLFRKQLFAA